MLIATITLLFLSLLLRVIPNLLAPHGAGVDQWFWKAYIESLRHERRFPPVLPQFLLDKAQWYPPLFPVLLAKMPAWVFERHAQMLAVLIDLLRLLLLVWAVRWLSGSDVAAIIAGVAYAITPLQITYNMQLNPRGLGALFLDVSWLCVGGILLFDASPWLWLIALLFAALVLITHKMTTQLFWFVALIGAGLALEIQLAALVPGGMLAAFLVSGGFYGKVFRAHLDIVWFWYHNWRWSGSNPVLESPIYGEPAYESPGKFYRSGFKPWLRRMQFVVGFNPWMSALLALGVIALYSGHRFSQVEAWVFAWLALTFAFALLTTIIPAMRCLGQGYLYGYNGSFPAALALGLTWISLGETWYWQLVVGATVLACLLALTLFFRALRSSRTMKVDSELDSAIQRLSSLPKGVVMCLPQHWHDVVAYRAGQPVAFGGHGYGFRLLEPVFPRLLITAKEVIARCGVRYLLTYQGYCNEKFLADLPPATIEAFGDYRLYRFDDAGEWR
jgi:hypothetical protein